VSSSFFVELWLIYLSVSEVLSDADSDYMELRSDIAKFKATVRKFQDEQRYGGKYERDLAFPQQGRGRTMRLRGGPRGPRKAAEPTGDIRARMGRASTAFIEENYEEAKTLVEEVIRINAETHEAWTLLAAIFRELGDRDKTLLAMIYAAHLRPKDAAQWLSAARYALEETGEQRTRILPSAKFCFSSAIRANPKDDFEARYGKAGVLREMGSTNAAIAEYKHLLRQRPHDTSILRSISEAYIDKDDVQSAQELYRDAVAFYRSTEGGPGELFNWSDVNIYVELFAYATQYTEAIRELRSLSRWLLGRQSETFWDDVMDDCEWDADSTRRIRVSGFQEDRFDLQTYGNGLPLELRVKFGIYRLWVGDAEEAKVSTLVSCVISGRF
jgi:general transcription factor 3C polypeptide 3 (transcription factor C subunit 4)